MKTKVALVCVMALWAGASHAQLRKCTAPDGKVTYSDAGCPSEKKESAVRGGTVTTMDTAGLRQYAGQSHVATRNVVQTVGSSSSKSAPAGSQGGYWKCE